MPFVGSARLRVIDQLGQGGMGVVYRAFDAERGVEVALKTLPRLDPTGILRFKQEFRALADVTHRNLVAYHELFQEEGRWFFTMELLRGQDFLGYVRRRVEGGRAPTPGSFVDAVTVTSSDVAKRSTDGAALRERDRSTEGAALGEPSSDPGEASPRGGAVLRSLDVARLRDALAQLVTAVLAVHAAGKLHRDIKPSNVLVTNEGRLVLLDFGLVRDAAPPQRDDEGLAGTPAYMAPEQIAGYEATEASDWYAVGVVLFEALTGRTPFVGSLPSILAQKPVEAAPAVRSLEPTATADLADLADALLARDPAARPKGEEVRQRLGLAPIELAAARRVAALGASAPRDLGSPFVGRDAPLAALRAAFADARRRPVSVRVFGPSGVGKSALVSRFLAEAREAGALVFVGRCYEQESVPYKALDSLVDELSTHLTSLPDAALARVIPPQATDLARVFPVLRRVPAFTTTKPPDRADQSEVRRRAFRALQTLLAALSAEAPVVLAIDDMQWGDVDSARLLLALFAKPDPGVPKASGARAALLGIGTYRSEAFEGSAMLAELDRARQEGRLDAMRDVELGALSEEDAFDLALALQGRSDETARVAARRIAQESEGSPFFVGELVRFDAARDPGDERRVSLEGVVRARVAALDDQARRALEVTAIAGQPIAQRLVLQATTACAPMGPHARTVPLALDGAAVFARLRAASLVRSHGLHGADAVVTYHDRIREAVTALIEPALRQRIHAALAYVIEEAQGADAERLALHHEAAGNLARAARYALQAADGAAEALAFERAARLYRWVLDRELPDGGPGARRAILRRLGEVLVAAGRGTEAARAFMSAANGEEEVAARELHRLAAEQLLVNGHIDEGLAILQTVLVTVGADVPKTPGRALASFLLRSAELRIRGLGFRERREHEIPPEVLARVDACFSASNGLTFSDPMRGAYFQALHLALALKAGEPMRVALGLANYGAFSAIEGAPVEARASAIVARADALAKRLDAPRAMGRATMARASIAFLNGRFRDAITGFDAAGAMFRARCTGVTWELDGTEFWTRLALYYAGDLAELRRRSAEHLADAEARGDLFVEASIGASAVAVRLLADDDGEGARRAVQRALGRWTAAGFHALHFLAVWHEALASIYVGDGAGALRVVADAWSHAERALLLRIQVCAVTLHHVRGAAAIAAADAAGSTGESARLLKEAERDVAFLERQRLPYSTALAAILAAGIASVRRDAAGAASQLELAAGGFDACDMALHAAVARRHAGAGAGGASGRALVAASDARLVREGIVRPDRWAAMIAPGFR